MLLVGEVLQKKDEVLQVVKGSLVVNTARSQKGALGNLPQEYKILMKRL